MTTLAHEEMQELLGAYALDAVDGSERRAFEQHLGDCADCRDEVARHRETLALLAIDEDVPEAIWEDIATRIAMPRADESARLEHGGARVIRFPLRRVTAWVAPAAAAAAAVAITLGVTGGDDLGKPVHDAAVESLSQEADVAGTVALYRPDQPNGRIVIDLRNVPPPPAGHHYEVWILRPGADVEMEAIGAFTPHNGVARIELSLPGPGEYVALDISVEENGGPPEHSGTSLARAVLQ
ncbi:MAG: anti-sigma factor [Actinobacteria bacterium]|nr:anti-sigma factor [Actinomycetota bacterium]